jgi:hypothetical protein
MAIPSQNGAASMDTVHLLKQTKLEEEKPPRAPRCVSIITVNTESVSFALPTHGILWLYKY